MKRLILFSLIVCLPFSSLFAYDLMLTAGAGYLYGEADFEAGAQSLQVPGGSVAGSFYGDFPIGGYFVFGAGYNIGNGLAVNGGWETTGLYMNLLAGPSFKVIDGDALDLEIGAGLSIGFDMFDRSGYLENTASLMTIGAGGSVIISYEIISHYVICLGISGGADFANMGNNDYFAVNDFNTGWYVYPTVTFGLMR